MNALTAIAIPAPIDVDWTAAQESVNAWRGRCLHIYGKTEFAISETLAACAADTKRGGDISLPHLLGQRIDSLAAAIGEGGPFVAEGAHASEALAGFRRHEAQRVPLAHGTGKIALDRQGQWTLILRMISFRLGRAERCATVWNQVEAAAFGAALSSDSHRLCAKLARFRQVLADG